MLAQKLGTVTGIYIIIGHDMANLCRMYYDKKISLYLWIMAEIAIIGADI
jgi:Mn2+/Fe2+ NRAMP family transporter